MAEVSLSVVILTYNEERHLERCLKSIAPLAPQVFVVDSYSTDRTVEIARAVGATVVQHPFTSQSAQFQWALDTLPLQSDWIMRLDADEIIEPDLVAAITAQLPQLAADVVGVKLKRKHIFMGRWIRHGGRYPVILLRIWRRGHGRIEKRWMDEHMIVWGGRSITLDGGFADENLNDLTFFTDKHNKYATREAVEVLNQKYRLFANDDLSSGSTSFQASAKRAIKKKFYNRLPFWLGPLGYFLYRYIIQLGFLDGTPGLIYHFLQGGWYRFLVGAKVYELDREIGPLPDRTKRVAELARLTGLKLSDTPPPNS